MGFILETVDGFETGNAGLNQDLLVSTDYLSTHCNQPDSESNNHQQFASAKCKQMDSLPNGDSHQSRSKIQSHSSTEQSTSEGRGHDWHSPETLTTKSSMVTRLHSDQANHRIHNNDHQLDADYVQSVSGDLNTQKESLSSHLEEYVTTAQVSSSSSASSISSNSSCQSVKYRGIEWPETNDSLVAIRPCPPETTGKN